MDNDTPRAQVEKFLSDTEDARHSSERCRDYFDYKQWTAEEAATLLRRKQAPIVVNRIKPKVKGLVGLYNMMKGDPKAWPRTKKHEKSAHAITDALRFVSDNNNFDSLRLDVAEEFFVEGYGGAFVNVKQVKSGDIEINIEQIPWDRIYFDPHSRRKDFKDARYMGIIMWMYREEAKETFPDADVEQLIQGEYTDETHEDRPRWVDTKSDRVRVALHFYIDKGQWQMCIFSGDYFIVEPQDSPFLDDDGEPTNPIELVSANIDRDNHRYGEVLGFLDQQDEINHRRSKFLHYLNNRQTWGRKGSIQDIATFKREMQKPDGHAEALGVFGTDWGFMDMPTAEQGQFALYQDAKAEMDSVSYNAQLSGERQQGDLSGRAIDKLQQAGTIELNQDYALLTGWENRVYRQVWSRIKQHWTAEKWIRVTDDQESLRWIGLNTQVTAREFLEEKINDESLPKIQRKSYAASYTFLTQLEDSNDPNQAQQASDALETPVDIQNPVAELDVDIILDQSFDVMNSQSEQFRLLAEFAQTSQDIDIIELIELSSLRNKEALIEKIENRRAQALQAQGDVAQIQSANEQMKGFKMAADADKSQAEADQKKVETQLILRDPTRITNLSI